jgi:hypothetical protein
MSKPEDQLFGNFWVDVRSEITELTETGQQFAVKFVIRFFDGTASPEIILPLTGPKSLQKADWYGLHPRVQIHRPLNIAQQLLANDIRAQLPGAPKETIVHIGRIGAHLIGDTLVFNTGGGIVRPPPVSEGNPTIIAEPSEYRMDIDPHLSERDAIAEMMNIVRLSPDAGRVIFAHSLLYLMRKAYEGAWKSPCCILFLYGYTGTKKTTFSSFMTQLHNRSDGIEDPPRLNASIPAAEAILYKKSDCVIVLDDLFPSRFRDMKVQQEKTFIEITRIIADGVGRGRMRGKQVSLGIPTCGVIFTGEYLIGTGSDAARLLPIQLTTPIDDVELGKCQAKPLVVSTFAHYFIAWYVENFVSIQALLKQWWGEYQNLDIGVHGRLWETHFFLSTAYRLFLKYCVDKDIIADQDEGHHHRSFVELLTRLVKAQHERVKQGDSNSPSTVDAFKLIRSLYKSDSLRLAKNRRRFDETPEKYDGLIHKGLLCLRGEQLLARLKRMGYAHTLSDVRNALISKEALYLDSEGKNKKLGNKRVYGIYLKKLS